MAPQHVSEGAPGACGCGCGSAASEGPAETACAGPKAAEAITTTPAAAAGAADKVGSVLIVGGGIAGMQAALDLAHSGFKVYVVDSNPSIGGTMAQLDKTFPTNDCSMCIMAPKLVEVGRHPNIELITYSEIDSVEGEAGKFRVRVKKKASYIDQEACTGCGACAQHCPIDAVSVFNEGLSERKAVFVPYPQAVPLIYTIERDKCIGCGLCESICLAKAVRYDDEDRLIELDVGSILLCPGFDEFDPVLKSEYGHGRYKNVLSSIEFERVLSASGPYKGHVQRPSDGDTPTKVAWIQCVGSRDSACGNNYCSSVCCTYAIKEAVIAKEHVKSIEPTIFYMDMRTHGKGFEGYYNRAENEYGVRFIRCRISKVEEDPKTRDLIIKYETEEGELMEEVFHMAVLSVGFKPKKNAQELADKLGLDLNEWGFCETPELAPNVTPREGVYVCGAFSGPKDIPESVMEASGAAAKASGLIASKRGTEITPAEHPPERDVSGEEPRIGVFVCNCGINIGGYVNVPSVAEYARSLPDVAYAEDNLYTCSQDTQNKITEKIKEHGLNRVIVASCTPRTHEPLFQETVAQAGLNPHLFEMANIRDQCSWVHQGDPERATEKARDLVRIAVTKARLLESLPEISLPVTQKGLVIGGGVAGMVSAIAIADQGYETYIIEKEAELGGNANHLRTTLGGEDIRGYLADLKARVEAHPNIKVYKSAKIDTLEGYIGNYKTRVDAGGEKTELEHGVVVVATGARESTPGEYLYGGDDRVITQRDLERRLGDGENFGEKTFVMIQCVGSRDENRPWCSRICCNEAVKNALTIKERHPDAQVYILYRDMRTYGFNEVFYEKARELGVIFIRYNKDEKPVVMKGADGLEVRTRDRILNEEMLITADHVVLAPAIEPPVEGNEELGKFLKVPLNADKFFLEAHVKLRPVDFATEGVFLAGMAHSPKSVGETISQAQAAASRALTLISKDTYTSEATISQPDDARCDGCAYCVGTCPFNAITLIEYMKDGAIKKTIDLNEAICKGCGVCMATCPKQGVFTRGFTYDMIMAQGKTATECASGPPAEWEPRIVAFCCNWCSYAGADLAGVSRFQYPPNVRIVRVMCSGMVHPNFVIETLMAGADAVVMCGCHPGDCHYLEGNMVAKNRAETLEMMLEDYGLEPERYRLEWISASESVKFAEVMKQVVEEIKAIGPSPYNQNA